MAILGKSKDQIEVRLEKLPINEANPTYFDEYAPLDQRDTLTDTVTRYIVPEDQAYAIKILFKKGFVLGKFDGGFSVLIKEKATGTQIYARQFAFGDESYSTDSDTIYRVTAIPSAVVDGVVKQHVQLAFHHLSPDEELSGRTDVICCDASQVGGIEVECRRTCFEKGEYPPDERLPGNSSNTALSLDDHDHVPKETISVKEEASFTSSTTIKAEPEEDRPRLENGKAKPEVIALDDSDDDSVPPVGKLVVQKLPTKSQTTIKNEPEEPSSISHNIPATRGQSKEERPAKRVKLESDVALPSIETDSELLRLKEEDELEEEELAVAQRVAQLIRKRNERKAKIAALENRSSVTPAPGHPSLS